MTARPEPEGVAADGRAGWREWLGLAVLLLPVLVLASDLTVLFLAMPSIAADLQPGAAQMLWILHVYGFLVGGFLVTMGRLADRVGRRRLLLLGAAAFAVLSLVAAYSTGPEMLIVVRALLGVAGAALMPPAFALLRSMFRDDGQRRFAIAVLFVGFSAGGAVGPLLGGVLLEYFHWGSVFLVNVPPLLILLAVGRSLLPEYREPAVRRLDPLSVVLSVGAVLLLVYGLQELAAAVEEVEPVTALPPLAVTVAGAGLLAAFVHRQSRLPDPLLDLELFRDRRFGTSVGMVLVIGIAVVGSFYLFTQYLQWVLGLSPLAAGLWTVPYIVLNIAGALAAPALVPRFGQVTVIAGGLAVTAAGMWLVAILAGGVSAPVVVGAVALVGLGHGVAIALVSDLIISTPPAERAGSAAAIQEVGGELGTALGVAVGGTVGVVAYRAVLSGALPAAIPQPVADEARESMPAALAVAERMPELGTELIAAARDAFTGGLRTGAVVGAVIATAAALLVPVLLRSATPAREVADDCS
ncbi:MFS transporter [Pseudonocardia sp. NPDC046786]|uniref:MFS transporter n=1 Tax=Pseudonocardia sp. NPDC046786 TaxID=3155471 RepID=UPI0033E36976